MDISIFTRERVASASRPAKLSFHFPNGRGAVSGLDELAQLCMVHLLSNTNTSSVNPQLGGNIPRILHNMSISEGSTDRISVALQVGISKVENDILLDQAQYSLPAAERLLSLTLSSVNIRRSGDKLYVDVGVRVTNELNQFIDISV